MTYVVTVPGATTRRSSLVTLGRAEVFARGGGSRARASRLLDAESPALVDLALERVLRRIGVLRADHLDESESAALAGVWVTHDVALLDSAVLLEEDSDLFLGQTRVDASDEEVGALVDFAGLSAAITTVAAVAATVLAGRRDVAV